MTRRKLCWGELGAVGAQQSSVPGTEQLCFQNSEEGPANCKWCIHTRAASGDKPRAAALWRRGHLCHCAPRDLNLEPPAGAHLAPTHILQNPAHIPKSAMLGVSGGLKVSTWTTKDCPALPLLCPDL